MAVELSRIQELLSSAFPRGAVRVGRLADDDEHYSIRIVSDDFSGKSRLEQHRMVYAALSGIDVHALQIQTEVEEQDGE
ncbi:MAG: BolA family protein [Anaplasma sp.]